MGQFIYETRMRRRAKVIGTFWKPRSGSRRTRKKLDEVFTIYQRTTPTDHGGDAPDMATVKGGGER